ncbi:ATP-dependent nuclease [Tindallia californiensis]|uniref:Putative ATP-dependent endonuclease of the OLD family n=1 Tax=Tindallia californiensis TaxID=159292 RepID=A0A1H3P7B3_9FIRM|nr:AAA family ATPase [Tindallia californiensis]SDY96259.1 putative ATP-dependent endonuclease of the OLD family [Tindallia californiensis]
MIFKHLTIKNFRNFKEVDIDLTNRNIIFGLNDIGKSNFLAALRYLLDRNYRRDGFVDSDYYNKDTSEEISITLTIQIDDNEDDSDNKKIFKMMKGAITSDAEVVFIQLNATYDKNKLVGEPNLFWGIDLNNLEDIPSKQQYFELDKCINVVYIDSSIQLESTFKKYSKEIFKKESSLTDEEREDLTTKIEELNDSVGDLSAIKTFEQEIVEEYKKFRDEQGFNVTIKSEIEVSNLHSKLTPYILNEVCETYPTAGDGRKKILAYTLLTLENRRQEEEKINIFLIEEIENHLHRSMQIALSYQIFSDEVFKYLFMTTHSSLIVSQMDEVNLIKLFQDCLVIGKSHTYVVPEEYKKLKQKLNQNLTEAIYADVVLLVEGPSEKILFERVLHDKCQRYESLGGYILEVDGINFSEYYNILTYLGIKVIVRTDNDLRFNKSRGDVNLLGVNRCLSLISEDLVDNLQINDIDEYEAEEEYRKDVKREIYDDHYSEKIDNLVMSNIYLSRIDLENDLYEAIQERMDDFASYNNSSKNGIDYLQEAKMKHMIGLCKYMDINDIDVIYNHDRFECIRELVSLCCQ